MAPSTRPRADGEHVTRAELQAHLERIDVQFGSVHEKLDQMLAALGAGRRWWGGRMTVAADAVLGRGLVLVLAALVAYFVSR